MAIKLSARSLARLKDVHPDLVKVVLKAATMSDIPFEVSEGLRSVAQQKENVKKGVSWTMNSRHLTGHAVDIRPLVDLNGDGKVTTNEMYTWSVYYKLAPIIKAAARAVGVAVEWGGDWKKSKDGPHWQLSRRSHPGPTALLGMTSAALVAQQGVPNAELEAAINDAPMDPETEQSAAIKAVSYAGTGAATGYGFAADPLADLAAGLSAQQYELTSGDAIRIGVGLLILGLSLWAAYKAAKG